eukprot:71449-Amphidinium_carterae.3
MNKKQASGSGGWAISDFNQLPVEAWCELADLVEMCRVQGPRRAGNTLPSLISLRRTTARWSHTIRECLRQRSTWRVLNGALARWLQRQVEASLLHGLHGGSWEKRKKRDLPGVEC